MTDYEQYKVKALTKEGWAVIGFLRINKDKCFVFGEKEAVEVLPDTICRCVGIRDKKGNMLYENDIISTTDKNYNPEYRFVEMSELYKGWITKRSFDCCGMIKLSEVHPFEIVGNYVLNSEDQKYISSQTTKGGVIDNSRCTRSDWRIR